MMILPDEDLVFYVMFRDSTDNSWWTRFLKRGFQHCYYIVGCSQGSIIVEHKISRVVVKYIELPPELLALNQLGYLRTRAVRFNHKPENKLTIRTVMNCVALTINGIGLQQTLAITPYALYRKLIKLGAEEL